MEPLQRPPHGLDVRGVHRPVGVVHVDPEADPARQLLPVVDVAPDRHAAALVELGDPELLDVTLAGGPDLLLHLDLDRQPVAVPSRLPVDEVARHRPVAGEDVLERARDERGRCAASRWPSGDRRRRPTPARPRVARSIDGTRRPRPRTAGSAPRAPGTAPSGRPAGTAARRRSPSVRLPTRETPRPRLARTRREPRGTTSLAGRLRGDRPLTAAITACRCHGRTRLRLPRTENRPGSGRGSGRMSARRSAPGSHRPRLARAPPSPRRVPVVAFRVHATPRGERDGGSSDGARDDTRRRAVAPHLRPGGDAPGKVFEVADLSRVEVLQRLREGRSRAGVGLADASTCYPSPP